MPTRLLRWMGGKIRVAHILVSLFPEDCEHYYEPFVGSGAVILNKLRQSLEVINDKDKKMATLHKILADREKGKILIDELYRQTVNKKEFKKAQNALRYNLRNMDDIELAKNEFIRRYFSFNGLGEAYYEISHREYINDISYHLPQIYERYRDVRVRCGCGIELMEEVAVNEKAFIFADPPYVKELRGRKNIYACEMSVEAHKRMLSIIKDAKCKVMLCGYAKEDGNDLYDRFLLPGGKWKRYKLAELSKSCQRNKDKRDVGIEYIWVNYELPYFARYVIDMSTEFSAAKM